MFGRDRCRHQAPTEIKFMDDSDLVFIQRTENSDLGFEAAFRKIEDRYHHVIALIEDDQKFDLLSSIEGDTTENWPPSPPLQQVYKQTIGNDPVILGVGMSGKSHFSTSLIIRVTETPHVVVESACLIKELDSLADLQTTYQVANGIECHEVDGTLRMICERHQITLKPLNNSTCLQRGEREIQLAPTSMASEKTIQWGYDIFCDYNNFQN